MNLEVVTDPRALTPVEKVGGLLFKREDLFSPFGIGGVNGGKLRQGWLLTEKAAEDGARGFITAASVRSPQTPIVAACARRLGLPCRCLYGGTNPVSLGKHPMVRLVEQYGGRASIVANTGRHAVLYEKARRIASREDLFVVEYGFNLRENPEALFGAVSDQVENIPEVENLVITCGSGISSTALLLGLHRFKKKIGTVHLVGVGPDRRERIRENLRSLGVDMPANVFLHDLYHRPRFAYEDAIRASFGGIVFHPLYEAKAFAWLYHESGLDLRNPTGGLLFWIVGAEPFPVATGRPGPHNTTTPGDRAARRLAGASTAASTCQPDRRSL